MHKTNLCSLLYIIFILSTITPISITPIKPIFSSSFMSFLQKVGSRSAMTGWFSYIGTHFFQKKKIDCLKDTCIHSPENTSQEYNSQLKNLENNYPLEMNFFYKKTLLECMKNKKKNLKNFNTCVNLSNKLIETE